MANPPKPDRIIALASLFYDSCVLFAASDLGVFSRLAEMPGATAEAIAAGLQLDPRGARLLLDACAAVGLLVKQEEQYRNTPEAEAFLVPGRPGDLSGAIRYNRDVFPAWGRLAELAQTGRPVEKPEMHFGEDEARTRTFVMSMHGRAMWISRALLPLLNLAGCRRLLDVGGGPGTFSVLLAQAYPELCCTVLDQPAVVKIAAELIARQAMSERVTTLAGDYHCTDFPAGNDVINIFGVLHQESPASIRDILGRCYRALAPGGRIHIMDMMTDKSHTAPKFSALFAINMALTTNAGWVFSDHEIGEWLTEAGFTGIEVVPLPSPVPHWLMKAQKA